MPLIEELKLLYFGLEKYQIVFKPHELPHKYNQIVNFGIILMESIVFSMKFMLDLSSFVMD